MRLAPVLSAAALALLLAGCGGAPAPAPAPDPESTTEVEADAQAEVEIAIGDPCDLLTVEELAAALDFEGDGGESNPAIVNQQGDTWQAEKCHWESDDLEVTLAISGTDDFEGGTIVCVPMISLGDDPVAVDGLGESAWFAFDDFFDPGGELRFCTDSMLIDLAAVYSDEIDIDDVDPVQLQQSLTELAESAEGRL